MDSGSPLRGARNDEQKAFADGLYRDIHLALLSGLPTNVARKDEQGLYRGTRERKFKVFPGSALAKKPPAWLFVAQILDLGGKVWGMQCARLEPAWIERQAAHLLKRTCSDPHWSRSRGAVQAFEQVSLYGLILVERRAVTFAKQLARCGAGVRTGFAVWIDPGRATRGDFREAGPGGGACDLPARSAGAL